MAADSDMNTSEPPWWSGLTDWQINKRLYADPPWGQATQAEWDRYYERMGR